MRKYAETVRLLAVLFILAIVVVHIVVYLKAKNEEQQKTQQHAD